jgi:hypothetical protein
LPEKHQNSMQSLSKHSTETAMKPANSPRQPAALPHYRVKARLGASPLSGVGVFALQSIQEGEAIFPADSEEIVWVGRSELESADLSETDKALYRDFAVFKADRCGCPADFDRLTSCWYLNRPDGHEEPNVRCDIDDGYRFYALRKIEAGEELTARYADYSLQSWL